MPDVPAPNPPNPSVSGDTSVVFSRSTDPQPNKPTEPPKVDRPAWLPEKFKTPEDMAKSYGELEKRFSRDGGAERTIAPAGGGEAAKAAPAAVPPVTPEAVPAVVAGATPAIREAYSMVQKEFDTTGGVTPASMQKLLDAGVSQEMFDTFVNGQKALISQRLSVVKEAVGGDEGNIQKMLSWAVANLPPNEIDAYNASVSDPAKEIATVKGMWARFVQANGYEPPSIGYSPAVGGAEGYESTAQMLSDMRDPRYKKDPAFIKKVEQKIARSNLYKR